MVIIGPMKVESVFLSVLLCLSAQIKAEILYSDYAIMPSLCKDKSDDDEFSRISDEFVAGLNGVGIKDFRYGNHQLIRMLLSKNKNSRLYAQSNKYNRAAQHLAGCHCCSQENHTLNEVFEDYSGFMNESWEKLEKNSLSLMDEWVEHNISALLQSVERVFYPFGGPDIVHAMKFFPQAQEYILGGLERLGNFDSISKNIEDTQYISVVRTAFSHYLRKGYFVTSQMLSHLSTKKNCGALDLILLELGRVGCYVYGVENVFITPSGDVVKMVDNRDQPTNLRAVKISFFCNGMSKTAYYVRGDLSNQAKKLPHLMHFVMQKKFATFLKSASYILHDDRFSNIRSFILNKAYAVLQDDTGIPFYKFADKDWDRRAYGRYVNPNLPVFKKYNQPLLAEFFMKSHAVPLPFKMGYGYNKARPNLLLAIHLSNVQKVQKILASSAKKKTCSCQQN